MAIMRPKPEEIVSKLRQVEVLMGHQSSAGVFVEVEAFNAQSVNSEFIAVYFARRRACAAKSGSTKVGTALDCAVRHFAIFGTCALRQRVHVRRDVKGNPMPPARAGRRVLS